MSQKNISILLADDDVEDSELLEEAILNIEPEARIKHVPNGKKAMEFLSNCSHPELPCLIILDYNMPEMTGVDVLAWLYSQARFRSIPKVVLSTSGAAVHVKQCLNNGASEYFVKPFNFKELEEITKKMLSFCHSN